VAPDAVNQPISTTGRPSRFRATNDLGDHLIGIATLSLPPGKGPLGTPVRRCYPRHLESGRDGRTTGEGRTLGQARRHVAEVEDRGWIRLPGREDNAGGGELGR
jgi:hypothetical protein